MMEKKFEVSHEDVNKLMTVFEKLNCRDIWSRVKREDFTVKRFAMGYVNDISCCELTDEARKRLCKTSDDLPSIVVKFVPKDFFFKLNRFEVVACNLLISEHKITPRLSYIDEHSAINEYIESRNYKQEDDLEPEMVKQLARLLARVHSLQPPISMDGFKLVKDKTDLHKPEFQDVMNKKYLKYLEQEQPEIKQKYYSTLAEIDLKETKEWIENLSKSVYSPIVFSHNDFNRGNRLVRETKRKDGSTYKQIYLIDFDFSTMNHRGVDLGRYFSNYGHLDDMFGDEGFPTDEELKLFIEEYRHECGRIQGEHYLNRKENSLDQLIKEVKVFTLNAYRDYFFCLLMYTNDPNGPRKDYFLQSSFNRFNAFKKLKQRLTEDGTISIVLESGLDQSNRSI